MIDAPPITFIHKNGKIIPIRKQVGDAVKKRVDQAKGASKFTHDAFKHVKQGVESTLETVGLKSQPIKVNRGLDALGLGLSVSSGIIGAATFSKGGKGVISGLLASHGLDAIGVGANLGSVAGKGQKKERLKQAGRQEARNFVIGNGIFVAGVLGLKRNRKVLGEVTSKLLKFGRKS